MLSNNNLILKVATLLKKAKNQLYGLDFMSQTKEKNISFNY